MHNEDKEIKNLVYLEYGEIRFDGWDAWKAFNKAGFDSTVSFLVNGNKIVVTTENAGIALKNTIEVTGIETTIYAALTGDQCAVTNIRTGRG